MLLFISISQSLPKIKVADCLWYRFAGKRKVAIENEEYEARIDPDDVYGMKRIKDNFYVVLQEDPSYVFPVTGPVIRSLLSRSKSFTGSVQGIKVKSDARQIDRTTGMETGKDSGLYEVAPMRGEDKDLTAAVRKIRLPGAQALKFMSVVTLPTGDVYTYYDASETFPDFDPKMPAADITKWEDKIEKAAVSALKAQGLIIGASILKYAGNKVPTLILVSEEQTLE